MAEEAEVVPSILLQMEVPEGMAEMQAMEVKGAPGETAIGQMVVILPTLMEAAAVAAAATAVQVGPEVPALHRIPVLVAAVEAAVTAMMDALDPQAAAAAVAAASLVSLVEVDQVAKVALIVEAMELLDKTVAF